MNNSKNITSDEQLQQCFICLESYLSTSKVIINPCKHHCCSVCLERWRQFSGKECPMCKQLITSSIQCSTNQQEDYIIIEKQQKDSEQINQENFEGIGHSFVQEMLNGIETLLFQIVDERFEKRGGRGTELEWQEIEKMRERLDQIQYENDQLLSFQPYERIKELYDITDMATIIKKGLFCKQEADERIQNQRRGANNQFFSNIEIRTSKKSKRQKRNKRAAKMSLQTQSSL